MLNVECGKERVVRAPRIRLVGCCQPPRSGAPKGRDRTAQGNALGTRGDEHDTALTGPLWRGSPVSQGFALGYVMTPFQGFGGTREDEGQALRERRRDGRETIQASGCNVP